MVFVLGQLSRDLKGNPLPYSQTNLPRSIHRFDRSFDLRINLKLKYPDLFAAIESNYRQESLPFQRY